MRFIKSLVIMFFVYAITLGFFEQISRESYKSFVKAYTTYFSMEDYETIVLDAVYTLGVIDYDMLSEKYDFSIQQYNIHKDYVELKVYFDNNTSMNDLFGANEDCVVPFTNLNNNCDFIYTGSYLVLSVDTIDNYVSDNSFTNENLIIIRKDQSESFINEIVELYSIDIDTIQKYSFSGDVIDTPAIVSINIENILILLAVATCIIAVVKISSQLKSFRMQSINGSSFVKVYFNNIFKYNLRFTIFLLFCILVVLAYIATTYNTWLAKYYIQENWLIIIWFIIAMFVSSFLTFALCYISSTFNFLDESNTYKKLSVFTILLTVLVLYMYVTKLPYSEFKDNHKYYNSYMKNIQRMVDLNYTIYSTKAYSSSELEIKYSEEQVEEYKKVIKDNEFIIEHRENYIPTRVYISTEIAQIESDYNFDKSKNYFIGTKCNEYESLVDILKINEHITDNIFNKGSRFTFLGDICFVIVSNVSDEITEHFVTYIDSTLIYAQELKSELFMRRGLTSTIDPFIIENIKYTLVEYAFWMVTLLLANVLVFVTYINSYRKYEYYRYINDAKYPLLFRYITIKILVNLFLLSLTIVNESMVYVLPILLLDIICYLGFRIYYKKRLIELKGE